MVLPYFAVSFSWMTSAAPGRTLLREVVVTRLDASPPGGEDHAALQSSFVSPRTPRTSNSSMRAK